MKSSFRFNVLCVVIVSVLALWLTSRVAAQGPGSQLPIKPTPVHIDSLTPPEAPLAPQVQLGTAFTYQGQLKKGATPVTGNCSMDFRLYDQSSGGSQVGGPLVLNVPVNNSLFTVQLDFGAAFTGEARWLGIRVQCPGDSVYTDLGRQAITAAPYALSLQPGSVISGSVSGGPVLQVYNGDPSTGGGYAIVAINRSGRTWDPAIYGENQGASAGVYGRSDGWNAVVGWNQSNSSAGVWGNNVGAGTGVRGDSTGGNGVYGYSAGANGTGVVGEANLGSSAYGVWGKSASAYGIVGTSYLAGSWNPDTPKDGGIGVYGENNLDKGFGVKGRADNGYGVYGLANSAVGSGGYFNNTGGGVGLRAGSSGGVALWASADGGTNSSPALRVHNNNTTNGIAAYLTNNSYAPTLEVDQSGSGRLLDLQTWGNGDFIAGFDGNVNQKFRIDASGTGHSSGGWSTSLQDYAEMLPAVEGLVPGDVLVIGDDGQLTRSTERYQANVVGVYSTKPGFVGGAPVEGTVTGTIPLAIVGIVPVRVSTENGAIHPGDLLVASSLPGYAMKAEPNPPVGAVIGKAWEKLEVAHSTGVIKMLVTLQ